MSIMINLKKGILFLNDSKKRSKFFGKKLVCYQILAKFAPFIKFIPLEIRKKFQNQIESLIEKNLLQQIDFENLSKSLEVSKSLVRNNNKIWMMWLQGEDNAPDIVKKCIARVREVSDSKGYEFNLITEENIDKFYEVPNFIERKYKEGIISNAHFADYYRTALLNMYGGIWLDATVYVASDNFDKVFTYGFYSIKHIDDYRSVAHQRWSTSYLESESGNLLMGMAAKALEIYWEKNDYAIDYLLIDYIFAIICNSYEDIKYMVDMVPFNNEHYYSLEKLLNKKYDLEKYNTMLIDTDVFKTNYKTNLKPDTDTFYARIIK